MWPFKNKQIEQLHRIVIRNNEEINELKAFKEKIEFIYNLRTGDKFSYDNFNTIEITINKISRKWIAYDKNCISGVSGNSYSFRQLKLSQFEFAKMILSDKKWIKRRIMH